MKRHIFAAVVLLLCFGLSGGVFAQATLGTLRGIVTDTDGAVLPGASIKITNADTGATQSELTNGSGGYSILVQPGQNYTITVDFAGFKKYTVNKLPVRMGDTTTVDTIKMEVGGPTDNIIVSVDKNLAMRELTQNLGITLGEEQIQELPLYGNDPLTLITTLPGYRANPMGHQFDTIGGLPMTMINTTRDGMSVTDGFNPGGVGSNTILNPDMISEIRLILNPVDAEIGRGNGQVQITTKSGTNKFEWHINYNLRQNALNSLGPSTTRVKQPFGATFQYFVTAGGPIWKNHTFFFVNWDHQLHFQRAASANVTAGNGAGFLGSGGLVQVPVLSDSARNGVFKYWNGWTLTNTSLGASTTGFCTAATGTTCVPTWPTILADSGLPVAPQYFPDTLNNAAGTVAGASPYDPGIGGVLKCYSVFGNIKFDGTLFDPSRDCGQYIPQAYNGSGSVSSNANWGPDYGGPLFGVGVVPIPANHQQIADPSLNASLVPSQTRVTWERSSRVFDRPPDRTGYTQRLLAFMPLPNMTTSNNVAGGQQFGFAGQTRITGNDVLNKGGFQWVRGTDGVDSRNAFAGGTFGVGTGLAQADVNHQIINIKIDHQIGSSHITRISMSTSFQNDQNDRSLFQSPYPGGIAVNPSGCDCLAPSASPTSSAIMGQAVRTPRVMTLNATTTLSSNMVNEARFGINFNRSTQLSPWDNPANGSMQKLAQSFLPLGWVDPNNGERTPIYFLPGSSTTNYNFEDNVLPYGTAGGNNGLTAGNFGRGFGTNQASPIPSGCNFQTRNTAGIDAGLVSFNCETGSRLFNLADTFTWNKGQHAIRGGGELRLTRAKEASGSTIPQATGGASPGTNSDLGTVCLLGSGVAATDCNLVGIPELPGYDGSTHGGRLLTDAQRSADLLYLLSGSVSGVTQAFWVNTVSNFQDGTWDTWSSPGDRSSRTRDQVQNEYALFIKDDWKIGKRLTVNLGIRYENYGNLYVKGFANGIVDQGYGLFGPERMRGPNPFDYWLTPGNLYYTGYGGLQGGAYVGQPPAINVTGSYLPNGQPSYIPGGNCFAPANPRAVPNLNGSSCTNPGGFVNGVPVQSIPAPLPPLPYPPGFGFGPSTLPVESYSAYVNCVYGVQQSNLLPVSNCDPSLLTTRIFVGPGSDHPNQSPLYKDANNFGPAIGFSYRLPFLSRQWLIRGGFQITYGSAGRDRNISTGSGGSLTQVSAGNTDGLDQTTATCANPLQCGLNIPGVTLSTNSEHAFVLADLPYIAPLNPVGISLFGGSAGNGAPRIGGSGNIGGGTNNVGVNSLYVQAWGVSQSRPSITAYSPSYQDPRTINLTFSVSTNINQKSSIALSYSGTLGRNRPTGVNINTPNIYHNTELMQALIDTRAGQDSPFFDAIFAGENFTGLGAADGFGPIGTCVLPTLGTTAADAAKGNMLRQLAPGQGAPWTPGTPFQKQNCPVGQWYQSGSMQLRRSSNTAWNAAAGSRVQQGLANGNFLAIATRLASDSPINTFIGGSRSGAMPINDPYTNGQATTDTFGVLTGEIMRNGCHRLANATQTNRSDLIGFDPTTGTIGPNGNPVRCLPEDFLIANPNISDGTTYQTQLPGAAGSSFSSNTSGAGSVYKDNWGYTNYHQFQAQYTVRLTFVNFQATYLTSKTLALPRDFYRSNTGVSNSSIGSQFGAVTGFTDPQTEATRRADYGLSSDSLARSVRLNGIFQLPFGPGKPFLSKSRGLVGMLLSNWQMSIIYNGQSGQPFSILAGDMMYGISNPGGTATYPGFAPAPACDAYSTNLLTGPQIGSAYENGCSSGLVFPDVVDPRWNNPKGKAVRNGNNGTTTYFGNPSPFALVRDPQCANSVGSANDIPNVSLSTSPVVTPFDLSSQCTIKALVMRVSPGTAGAKPINVWDPSQTDTTPALLMLQNPQPGHQGTLGAQTMRQPGRNYLDASISKRFMFTESKGIEIRLDATNVLNHPQPSDMYIGLGPQEAGIPQLSIESDSTRSALASGCFGGNTQCGRQIQFSFRVIGQ